MSEDPNTATTEEPVGYPPKPGQPPTPQPQPCATGTVDETPSTNEPTETE